MYALRQRSKSVTLIICKTICIPPPLQVNYSHAKVVFIHLNRSASYEHKPKGTDDFSTRN